jgi:hypothetical protein
MTTSEERQIILQMIADGKITPGEGKQLLAALRGEQPPSSEQLPSGELPSGGELQPGNKALPGDATLHDEMPPEPAAQAEAASAAPPPESTMEESAHLPEQEVVEPPPPVDVNLPNTQHWWQVPFWIGLAITIAGAFMTAGTLQSGAACLLLLCAFPMLVIGLLLIIAAWFARNGPWVHIRVKHNRPGERNVNLSVPLDLSVMAVRMAEPFVPQMRRTGVDDVLVSMKDNVKKDQPLIIDVNDDDNGEHVQVIVG